MPWHWLFFARFRIYVNPVRNSSGALNPVRDLSLNGINPALRGGTRNYLKCNPTAAAGPGSAQEGLLTRREQRGIIPNGVKVVSLAMSHENTSD